MVAESFDIHAHYHRFMIYKYEDVASWYEPHLRLVAEKALEDAETRLKVFYDPISSQVWPLPDTDEFLAALRRHLIGRTSHWKAEALKYVPRPSRQLSTDREPVELDAPNEKLRREKLFADYKTATGNPANRQIYNARNSGIHKPQFYAWLSGSLPADSGTAKNFERFLREKKAPIPRKPKA
jgi:hypothetical protein